MHRFRDLIPITSVCVGICKAKYTPAIHGSTLEWTNVSNRNHQHAVRSAGKVMEWAAKRAHFVVANKAGHLIDVLFK